MLELVPEAFNRRYWILRVCSKLSQSEDVKLDVRCEDVDEHFWNMELVPEIKRR